MSVYIGLALLKTLNFLNSILHEVLGCAPIIILIILFYMGGQAAALPEPIHPLYPASLVCRSADISLDLTVVLCPAKKIHLPDSLRQNLLQKTATEKT